MPSTPQKQNFARRVGLLGGGQLARMLALKGHQLGLEMHVLSKSPQDPAAQVVSHHHVGDPDNPKDVSKFCQSVDVLSFESEFHSGRMLAEIREHVATEMHPSPTVLSRLQDRLPQKESLQEFDIPTAAFLSVKSKDDLALATKHFKNKFVLKKRFGGYDGYGTALVKTPADLENAQKKINIVESPCIAEALVPFKRELALVMARNSRGQIAVGPLVETRQVDHRLDWLRGPVGHRKASALIRRLKIFLKRIDYVGAIAFELFDTGHDLLVNEIAPRVHNSGHASIEAQDVDQFELHLRAILNWDLRDVKLNAKAFALVNLIGAGTETAQAPVGLKSHLHWYGKKESRQGRKMGHMTALGTKTSQCLQLLLKERKGFKL